MAKLALLQFDSDPDCEARREIVNALGVSVVEDEPRWPVFFDTIERERPDAVVIACSKLSQHAREAARYLGEGFNTRNIPVFLIDVPAAELEQTRAAAPRATIVDREKLAEALRKVLR